MIFFINKKFNHTSIHDSVLLTFTIVLDIVSPTLDHTGMSWFITITEVHRNVLKVFQYHVESTWNLIELNFQVSLTLKSKIWKTA